MAGTTHCSFTCLWVKMSILEATSPVFCRRGLCATSGGLATCENSARISEWNFRHGLREIPQEIHAAIVYRPLNSVSEARPRWQIPDMRKHVPPEGRGSARLGSCSQTLREMSACVSSAELFTDQIYPCFYKSELDPFSTARLRLPARSRPDRGLPRRVP
jgi:hypothetical protein